MEAAELRGLGPDELQARVKQWREELFRARLNADNKDKSVFRKLKKEIARALTVLNEKTVAAKHEERHGREA